MTTTINIKSVTINITAKEQESAAKEAVRKYLSRPFDPKTDGTEIEIDDERLPKSIRRAIGNLKHCTMGF
jgi:hypothetical protein